MLRKQCNTSDGEENSLSAGQAYRVDLLSREDRKERFVRLPMGGPIWIV